MSGQWHGGKGSRARKTGVPQAVVDANWDTIFGKRSKEMQVRAKDNGDDFGTCGCGRSPTGKCIGWHGLNEDQLVEARRIWDLEEYKKEAQGLWNDSCTSGRAE